MNDKNIGDSIREDMDTDRIAEALDAYMESKGRKALEENQALSDSPEYRLSPQMDKKLARVVSHGLRAAPSHRRFRLRVLLIAAILLAAMIATNASAIRSFIGNYFLSRNESSMDFSERVQPAHLSDRLIPMPTVLPEGFEQSNDSPRFYPDFTEITFVNGKADIIRFFVYADGATIRLNSEDAAGSEEIEICCEPGIYLLVDDRVTLFWGKSPPFQLRGPTRLKDELIEMAESVKQPEDPAENRGG